MNTSKTFTNVELVSLVKVIALGGYKIEMDDVISSLHVTLPDLTSYATIMSVWYSSYTNVNIWVTLKSGNENLSDW